VLTDASVWKPVRVPFQETLVAFPGDDIRAAQDPVLARVPDGTLIDKAAAGLATVCVGLLRDRFGGVYGRRVVLLVGPGNNGGDALIAGALLRRRGAKVDAILVSDNAYGRGLTALSGALTGVNHGQGPKSAKIA
jgi:NAD(P)H-hydrate repair Nnr-like enzyme with NAD(P)H-hydrate epimerase domain